ncbi:MAG: AraC family transcriptional regulator [Acinetobacter sp.]
MLNKLIELAQIQGGLDTECQFGGEWLYSISALKSTAMIHIVRQGKGWLYINHKKIQIDVGDVIFFPHGAAHQLFHFQENTADDQILEKQSESVQEIVAVKQTSGLVLKTTHSQQFNLKLFCAHFTYSEDADLFIQLPEFIHLNIEPLLLEPLLNLLEQEKAQTIGQIKVINALSEVLLIYIFRTYLKTRHDHISSRLIEWNTSKLSQLIHAILKSPENKWSLDSMADFLHCTRIQLIRLFKKDLHTTPHAFLLKIRLQHATLLLKTSHLSIYNIALNLGFQSETHFGRVFKQHYGMTPHCYRNSK